MKRFQISLATLATLILAVGCASEEHPAPDTETPATSSDEHNSESREAGDAEHEDHEHTMFALTSENTKVEFTGVKKSGDSHSGGFNTLTGEMEICEGSVLGIMVTIETDSLYSDAEKLTGHLKNEDFFSVNEFPEMKFESSSIKGEGDVTVTGMLTMHGKTEEVSFPATITVDGETAKLNAEFKVDRTRFGMDYVGQPNDPINAEVDIKVTVGG